MTNLTKKMSPSQILSHLIKGQGMSLDAEAVREVINSLGEVGFSATRIAKIIKGDAAEIADFKRLLQERAKTNADLRKIAELGLDRIKESLKRPHPDAPVKERHTKKQDSGLKKPDERAAIPPEKPTEKGHQSLIEIMTDDHCDPLQAILRGPRPTGF